MATYRDTDYQNQHSVMGAPGGGDFGAPGTATGASAIGAVLTGGVAPTVQQPVTGPLNAPAAPAPAPVSTYDRIKLLQLKLNGLGASLQVDGLMGPKTQAAMTRYGLDVNGNPVQQTPAAAGTGSGASAPTAAPGGGAPAAAPAAPAVDVETQIREKYGYLGTILLDNPDIHKVLVDAVNGGWGQAQVEGALMNTDYWKNTQASVRNWDTLKGTDPRTATAQVQQQAADITTAAAKLGISIGSDRLSQMAEDSLRYGWDATQLQQAIGNEFHYIAGQQTGQLAVAEGQLRQMAHDYMVPLTDDTLAGWESQIAKGQATTDAFRGYLVGQAKSTYQAPWIQQGLDGGQTMQQLADPYRQVAAKDLEVAPDTIDFSQPQWSKALTYLDPKSGQKTGMSLADWQTEIRSNPLYGFQRTQTARDMAFDTVLGLEKDLGKVA